MYTHNISCRLLSPSCAILNALGEFFKFETAVGLNGRVWVHSRCLPHTIAVSNAILNSEHLTTDQCAEVAREIAQRI